MTNEIAWAGFEFQTPDDWEVCRHSLSCRNGGLVLVDRRRQRMELTWRSCDREPDLAHGCRDLRQRFGAEDGNESCRLLEAIPGWIGFWRPMADRSAVAYALHWGRGSGRIFQANIVARDDDRIPPGRLAEGVLSSFADAGFEGRAVRWKAFGIDCRPPPGWTLVSTRVNPMDVTWRFRRSGEGGRSTDGGEAIVQRLGMADTWFRGDARAYLRGQAPEFDFAFEDTVYRGVPAVAALARDRTRLFHRLAGRQRTRRDLIWQCEPANALFRVTTICPPRRDIRPEDFGVGRQNGSERV